MLREGNFRAVTTKLRLKQTPMTLFSSQTSDSFHFLNNKAFLWNEVTASICQVDISTKISQECGWRGLASRAPEAGEPLLLGSTGTNCHRTDVERSLCGTITQTLLGVWFTSSLEQDPHTAQLKSQKVRKRAQTCHKGWPGTGRREQNGATGPTAPGGWVRSRVGVISRSAGTHSRMHSAKGKAHILLLHSTACGTGHSSCHTPCHTWNAKYLRQSSYSLRTQLGRGFGFVLSLFLEFGSLYFDLSVSGMLNTQSFFWFQAKPVQFFWKAHLHLDADEDSSSCQNPLIWLLSSCEWPLTQLPYNFETLSSRFNTPTSGSPI